MLPLLTRLLKILKQHDIAAFPMHLGEQHKLAVGRNGQAGSPEHGPFGGAANGAGLPRREVKNRNRPRSFFAGEVIHATAGDLPVPPMTNFRELRDSTLVATSGGCFPQPYISQPSVINELSIGRLLSL